MPVDFEIDHRAKRVTARAHGRVELADILAYLDAIAVAAAGPYPKLFDAREADFELTDEDMMVLAARARAYEAFRPGPVAFVIDRTRGSTPFVQRHQNLTKTGREVELFESLDAAQQWLAYFSTEDD